MRAGTDVLLRRADPHAMLKTARLLAHVHGIGAVSYWDVTDGGSPGPTGRVPPRARRHRYRLSGPDARQPASAVPSRTSWTPGAVSRNCPRRADSVSPAGTARGDLPNSSQHGNSSHPKRRMGAVQ